MKIILTILFTIFFTSNLNAEILMGKVQLNFSIGKNTLYELDCSKNLNELYNKQIFNENKHLAKNLCQNKMLKETNTDIYLLNYEDIKTLLDNNKYSILKPENKYKTIFNINHEVKKTSTSFGGYRIKAVNQKLNKLNFIPNEITIIENNENNVITKFKPKVIFKVNIYSIILLYPNNDKFVHIKKDLNNIVVKNNDNEKNLNKENTILEIPTIYIKPFYFTNSYVIEDNKYCKENKIFIKSIEQYSGFNCPTKSTYLFNENDYIFKDKSEEDSFSKVLWSEYIYNQYYTLENKKFLIYDLISFSRYYNQKEFIKKKY